MGLPARGEEGDKTKLPSLRQRLFKESPEVPPKGPTMGPDFNFLKRSKDPAENVDLLIFEWRGMAKMGWEGRKY